MLKPSLLKSGPARALAPDELLSRLLFRDGLMLIIDKPAGLPVHAGPGGGPNVEQYLDALRFGLPKLPALAHRLDRDTSGCLILGRHVKALRKLGKLFQEGRIEKTYWAVVEGAPVEPAGRIYIPLRKFNQKTGWRMLADPKGEGPDSQSAVTDYKVLGSAGDLTWIECHPKTGRTHQIRVHLQYLGCPILGDPVYGKTTTDKTVGLHLHSRAIAVPLYPKREPIVAVAPPPPHMLKALKACGFVDVGKESGTASST
jgi:RluA family pseudouridine synthase